MPKLGVNVDHVATLREARRVLYPDPVEAALLAVGAGADAITVHRREDARHIQDRDLFRLREVLTVHLNQELAPVDSMVELALRVRPDEVCLVPERREELTTEGGLDVCGLASRLRPMVAEFKRRSIAVSLFIEPEPHQIEAAGDIGADFVELHTGRYANLADADGQGWEGRLTRGELGESARSELERLAAAARLGQERGLRVNAGHGLNYRNLPPVLEIPQLCWLHIGHAIVARAVMVGMTQAVREMKALIDASGS